jgi:CRP/FNR family cyclic AMP-dependent transcriptional regulator
VSEVREVPPTLLRFDIDALLPPGSAGRKIARFLKNQVIFSQGERSGALFYIEEGCVKLTVQCRMGKEAIIGIFGRGEWFGESCLARRQTVRFGNAIALTDVRAVQINRSTVLHVLRTEAQTSYSFITYLLARNTQIREDLVYNLLNSSERRLARVLSTLALSEAKGKSELYPNVSQKTLAEMIGSTRQRVNLLMQRFRKLGVIEDDYVLKIRDSLLNRGRYD